LTKAIAKTGESNKVVILVATSGDTGKAALEGFANVKDTEIIVFYPEDGVSAIQKRQMLTQAGDNVRVIGIQGNFDDAQRGVKELFGDTAQEDGAAEKGLCVQLGQFDQLGASGTADRVLFQRLQRCCGQWPYQSG